MSGMIERYPGRPRWVDEQTQRPGTKALRVALLGIPGGALGLVVFFSIANSLSGDSSAALAAGFVLWLLSVASLLALLVGLVGLFVGTWRRLS